MSNPMDYIHQTVAHQLRRAEADIEGGQGIVLDFDYDEEVDRDYVEVGLSMEPDEVKERTVTLELTYLLPE